MSRNKSTAITNPNKDQNPQTQRKQPTSDAHIDAYFREAKAMQEVLKTSGHIDLDPIQQIAFRRHATPAFFQFLNQRPPQSHVVTATIITDEETAADPEHTKALYIASLRQPHLQFQVIGTNNPGQFIGQNPSSSVTSDSKPSSGSTDSIPSSDGSTTSSNKTSLDSTSQTSSASFSQERMRRLSQTSTTSAASSNTNSTSSVLSFSSTKK